jgi:uncharacterized protein YegL
MDNHLNLNKLTFGSDDAELDEKHGFLDKVFLKTSIYNRAKESKRELVIGRKGSGKSAICLMLKKAFEGEGVSTILITPKSFSQKKLEHLKMFSINKDESYFLSWKYALLVTLSTKLLEFVKQQKKIKRKKGTRIALRNVRKFLVDNEELDKDISERFSKGINIFSKISIKAYGVEGSAETKQLQDQRDIATDLEKFQSQVERLLFEAGPKCLVVLIDKVDEVWNQTEESEMMIVGLIKAVHDLNSTLQQTQFILFLRSDIYNTLKFNDADKLHSLEEHIEWSEADLKHLIANRAIVSGDFPSKEVDELLGSIFPIKVNGEPSFTYFLKRSLMRPRELIQFCNIALAKAQDNSHNSITESDILSAERIYSNWKLKDLASEFAVQYPYLEDALAMFQGFKIAFTYDEFDKRYRETKTKLVDLEIQNVSTDKILQVLFIIGFLGAIIGEKKVFVYHDSLILLPQQKCITVHPAYHLALGLQNSPNSCSESDLFLFQGEVNIAGDIVGRDKVTQTKYGPILSSSRELEEIEFKLKGLINEEATLQKKIASYAVPTDVPLVLENRLNDLKNQIINFEQKSKTVLQYLSDKRDSQYTTLATSSTPALIIYVVDISGSMQSPMGNHTRIYYVNDLLQKTFMEMVARSAKQGMIRPRYNVALIAYSSDIYDIFGGVTPIDQVVNQGIPSLSPQTTTNTAHAFRYVKQIIEEQIPINQNNPAPLVCHITDAENTYENPSPVIKEIMEMSVPDGNVLVVNILISDAMLAKPVESLSKWAGIRSIDNLNTKFAKILFEGSSTIPESYRNSMNRDGLNIASDAKMLFPGNTFEFMKMAFATTSISGWAKPLQRDND